MKHTIKVFMIAALFLFGCGEDRADPEPLNPFPSNALQDTFAAAKECTGIDEPPPKIFVIAIGYWPLPDKYSGYYFGKTQTALIKADGNELQTSSHEYVHHLLWVRQGDADVCHRSDLFVSCAQTVFEVC